MYTLLMTIYIIYFFAYLIKIKSKIFYKLIMITMPIPIIFFDPLESYLKNDYYVDTVRIFSEIDAFRLFGWEHIKTYDSFILSKIYIYSFSLIDANFLLPVINCFLVYFILMYIFYKLGDYLAISDRKKQFVILFIAYMARYVLITTNIRFPLALAIGFLLLSYDIMENKYSKLCWLGYCILPMLHPAMVVLLFLRIIINFSIKVTLPIIFGILGIGLLSYDMIIGLLLSLPIDLIIGILTKYQTYTAEEIMDFSFISNLVNLSVDIGALIVSFCLFKSLLNEIRNKYIKYLRLTLILSVIGIINVILNTQFIGRFECLLVYLLGISIYLFSKEKYFKISYKRYKYISLFSTNIMIYLILVYAIYYNVIIAMRAF